MRFILLIFILISSFFLSVKPVSAQTTSPETLVGQVTAITETGTERFMDDWVPYQKLRIKVLKGPRKDQEIEIRHSAIGGASISSVGFTAYKVGDKLNITAFPGENENELQFNITGQVKSDGLWKLILLFVLVVLIVGRVWGALSLAGLGLSFLVIFQLIIPLIIDGKNPVLSAIIGALVIVPITFYISHGFNKKTHVGVAATFIGLIITGLLAVYFVDATHLTGFASEEAGFLQVERQGSIDIRGLLLAGIIIGTLGILDDVTVGQASTVLQLKKANKNMKLWELFKNGMQVGQDHISSMVNTLVLVYSGSALPLLLLFFDSQKSFFDILEFELIAEEIVRMLVGSIGLVVAAPLATLMAAYLFTREKKKSPAISALPDQPVHPSKP